ncbi:DUF4859 domain-containing protein [Thermophagus sp. OGC60D27]|uniref:DUF4859 domain-containing protein n=1 Tax=Thermophagus sp. OGC60D27 TaxID=3458415 RepID=UPI0040382DC4
MKKYILKVLIGCLVFSFFSCEDSIEDATGKHVYGEDENPYLKVDVEATITLDVEFEVGRFEPQIVNLADYSEKFQAQIGMTVDEVINGLSNGSIVFYNINVAKGQWDKSEPTKGSNGWYYNSAGGITAESEDFVASLEFNKESKQLMVNVNENAEAGHSFSFNVGFALNGADYDNYVRFAFNVATTDPSLIITNVNIPEGDYASGPVNLYDYADVIQYNLGLTVDEFLANLDSNEGGTIRLYVIDNETGEWDFTSNYTANPPGYWLNADGEVCAWGEEGFSLYAEVNTEDGILNIGRAPELAAGETFKIRFGFRDTTDEMKFIRFIITATLE